jgi:hypothetical protein
MTRQIIYGGETENSFVLHGGAKPRKDDYQQILFKLIPTDVITLYMTVSEFVHSAKDGSVVGQWVVLGLGFIALQAALWLTEVADKWQYALSSVAFILWAGVLGGPFATLKLPSYTFGVATAFFTFLVPLILKRRKAP